MSARMPVVFMSHGAPDALLKAPDSVACWREFGQTIAEPKAILVIPAHWEARHPTVSLSGAPETIHDFTYGGLYMDAYLSRSSESAMPVRQ